MLGELLVTAGVLVLLFLGWQLWWNDWLVAGAQSNAAQQLSRAWEHSPSTQAPEPLEPVVAAEPGAGESFANLYVPRFGDSYVRTIAQGTGRDVLNSNELGIGHYAGTQMPGEVGNFAIAGHRSAYGGAMHLIDQLQPGDPIVVETADGWYTYLFRSREIVPPTQVGVLAAVPNAPEEVATERLVTLTSCHPLYSTAERIVAYGVFESWQPRTGGPPASVASAALGEG